MFILRPYQTNAITTLKHAFMSGSKAPCLVLPCGGGKSVICASIAKGATDKHNRVLFLVHRIELVEQIAETFARYGVDMDLCDISMVQSARKLNSDYKLIITDESHHSACDTYVNVYKRYASVPKIFVTATPCRNDSRGLGAVCDKLINTVSVDWLIDNKYLAPYKYYSVNLMDTQPTKIRGEWGGYKIQGDYMKYYKHGSKVICYCSSLAHSMAVCAAFNARGINCAHIDGNTVKNERRAIIERFRRGDVSVLCNFSLLGEGFDVPDCDTVFLLRKTSSLNLFIQMSMRCMRYVEGKTAYIYDFCCNCYEHGLPDDDRTWTLDVRTSMARNKNSEPDILVRQCQHCMRVYSGTGRVCPYCEHDNGKTAREIEEDKKAELIEIKKNEVNSARTLNELIAIGRARGYKNPVYWAKCRYYNSWRREI